jgi:hypothetical protein
MMLYAQSRKESCYWCLQVSVTPNGHRHRFSKPTPCFTSFAAFALSSNCDSNQRLINQHQPIVFFFDARVLGARGCAGDKRARREVQRSPAWRATRFERKMRCGRRGKFSWEKNHPEPVEKKRSQKNRFRCDRSKSSPLARPFSREM